MRFLSLYPLALALITSPINCQMYCMPTVDNVLVMQQEFKETARAITGTWQTESIAFGTAIYRETTLSVDAIAYHFKDIIDTFVNKLKKLERFKFVPGYQQEIVKLRKTLFPDNVPGAQLVYDMPDYHIDSEKGLNALVASSTVLSILWRVHGADYANGTPDQLCIDAGFSAAIGLVVYGIISWHELLCANRKKNKKLALIEKLNEELSTYVCTTIVPVLDALELVAA